MSPGRRPPRRRPLRVWPLHLPTRKPLTFRSGSTESPGGHQRQMSVRRDRDPRTASSEGVRVTQRGRAVTIGETDPRTSEGQDVPVTPQTALSPHAVQPSPSCYPAYHHPTTTCSRLLQAPDKPPLVT